MTDHLSTIRQSLEYWRDDCREGDIERIGIAHLACDDLEAERLTPEEARLILHNAHNSLHSNHDLDLIALVAKLERMAR